MIKYIILLVINLVIILVGTGCDDKRIEAFLNTDLQKAMTSRVYANYAIVNRLYNSGLISEKEKKTIEETIDKQVGVYLNGDIANNKELQNKLLASVVDWSAPDWEDYKPFQTLDVNGVPKIINSLGYTKDEWDQNIITTYIKHNAMGQFSIPLFKGIGTQLKPLSIIDGKTGEDINKRLGYHVYVLKQFDSTEDSEKGLDEIIQVISEATNNSNKINNNVLDKYFVKAVDANGDSVTLLDIAQRNNRVVADSIGSQLVTDEKYKWDNGKLTQDVIGNKVKKKINIDNKIFSTKIDLAQPGRDMVIKDASGRVPLLAIRFHEFNSEAVDNIAKTLGMNPDQYLFTTYGGDNRVYIMEYPVYYISKIKNKEGSIDEYISEFAKSNIGINIRTGKLIKYGKAWGSETDQGVYFEDSDPYLTIGGTTSKKGSLTSSSSFTIDSQPVNIEVGSRKAQVKAGRIILRDYLEANYAPKVVDNENIVVFGRKIRVLKFNGTKNDIVAKYYDKDGKELPDSTNLRIDDFADFNSLDASSPVVKYIGRIGEAPSQSSQSSQPSQSSNGGDDSLKSTLMKIDDLETSVVNEIEPTAQFPGARLGAVDYSKSNKPLFYALTVRKNVFDTALFSGWISKEDSEKNSLDWWLKWLASPNRGYLYTINKNKLEDYLAGNYTFELQKEGIILLDLMTVSKIQKDYAKQDGYNTMRWFRTLFVVLGWAVVSYSIILMMAWAVDTNVDLGFNILSKLTLGNWVAVKDNAEIPSIDDDKKKYLDFRSIAIKALWVAIIGVILILVDIIDIVVFLIEVFGTVAKVIYQIVAGS